MEEGSITFVIECVDYVKLFIITSFRIVPKILTRGKNKENKKTSMKIIMIFKN